MTELHRDTCLRCRQGTHTGANRSCTHCGSTDKYPVRSCRRRIIGGKRGRNSGTVKTSKTKK